MKVIIPDRAAPLAEREVQPDAPHMSAHETRMARETLALWHKYGTARHWPFLLQSIAPNMTFLSGTQTPLAIVQSKGGGSPTADMNLAWYMHPEAVAVAADVVVACSASDTFNLRIEAVQTVNAMSTVNGAYSEDLSQIAGMPLTRGSWLRGANECGYEVLKRVRLEVIPTPPASRRFALRLRGQWASDWGSNVSGGNETEVAIYVHSVTAYDIMAEPT